MKGADETLSSSVPGSSSPAASGGAAHAPALSARPAASKNTGGEDTRRRLLMGSAPSVQKACRASDRRDPGSFEEPDPRHGSRGLDRRSLTIRRDLAFHRIAYKR